MFASFFISSIAQIHIYSLSLHIKCRQLPLQVRGALVGLLIYIWSLSRFIFILLVKQGRNGNLPF